MIKKLLEQWSRHLVILRGLSPVSVEKYSGIIVEFFDWYKTARPGGLPADVGRKDIEGYLKYLFFTRKNTNMTRRTKITALSMFWKFLVYEGISKEDVTAQIPKPKVHKRFVQYFTQPEVLRFFRQVDIYSEKGIRDACILILFVFCGLRVGELCGLRLNDVVDDGDYIDIQVPDDIGKQGSSRTVDLWKSPSVFIRQWVQIRLSQGATGTSSLLVSYRKGGVCMGNPLIATDISRLIKVLGEKAGIRKARIHAHMFRATHGSDLRNIRGYDICAIADRLGHKNISTTDTYLPKRNRISKEYRSLREYWLEWESIWTGDDHG